MITPEELSSEFDVLYNNITSNQAPGLNEYEKSVFLTRAQNELIISYFNPKLNKPQDGFDDSEERQIDFSNIIKTESYSDFSSPALDTHHNSKRVILDDSIMMIINEFVDVTRNVVNKESIRLAVVPLDYKEYTRLMSRPCKRPLKYQAWRVFANDNTVELIVGSTDTIDKYTIRYVKKPKPIILDNLEGLKIEGYSTPQDLELDPLMYPPIVQRAAELAKAAYAGDLNAQVVLGTTSQTNIGAVPQSR